MYNLIKNRTIDGKIVKKNGKTYSEWNKEGRLNMLNHLSMPKVAMH